MICFATRSSFFVRKGFVGLLIGLTVLLQALPSEANEWLKVSQLDGTEHAFVDAVLRVSEKASKDLNVNLPPPDLVKNEILELGSVLESRGIEFMDARRRVELMARVLFRQYGFRVDRSFAADAKVNNVLFPRVIELREGVCLSLSLLYLSLAEHLGLPLFGVSTPLHFFVRHDDGEISMNIETLHEGRVVGNDATYASHFYVREGEPFYMKNLMPQEVMGVYLSNLGAIYTREGLASEAIPILEAAKVLNRSDAESYTNLGIALLKTHRIDEAMEEWKKAIAVNEFDDRAHYLLALQFYLDGDYALALEYYDQALRLGHSVDHVLLRALEPYRQDHLYESEAKKI